MTTDRDTPDQRSGSGSRPLGIALVLISTAQLMVVLDGSVVNIALPRIQDDLGISDADLTWVVTAYAVAFGGLLLLGGRLGDVLGRRRIFLCGVLVFAVRFPPPRLAAPAASLVAGSVVIADDYFKSLVAGLHTFFGGRVRSYESLVDRARREAVLRMKAEARARGAGMIVNVKFQTFAIPGRRPGSTRAVEVLAYGTAVVLE